MAETALPVSRNAVAHLISHFDETGLRYRCESPEEVTLGLRCGAVACRMRIRFNDVSVLFLTNIPTFVAERRRPALYEALARLNWTMTMTTFEMDPADGEMRIRAALPLVDGAALPDALEAMFHLSWQAADKYAEALVELAVSDAAPVDVLARAEASAEDGEDD